MHHQKVNRPLLPWLKRSAEDAEQGVRGRCKARQDRQGKEEAGVRGRSKRGARAGRQIALNSPVAPITSDAAARAGNEACAQSAGWCLPVWAGGAARAGKARRKQVSEAEANAERGRVEQHGQATARILRSDRLS